jgi:predicted ATP-dependent endonuclease of OLD family
MSVKISAFEIENVKRVKAVAYEPTENGLTVLGGKNGQGKTSVLDAIAWALGGNRFAPSAPYREGSTIPPHLKIKLSNGIVVERSGKNSSLKVIDTLGNKGGQALLDAFVSNFALDLPKFMNATGKEKADTLLQVIGVGNKVYELEKQETSIYNERRAIGQIADQKKKFAAEMPEYEDVPNEPVSASELIRQQQTILAQNGENARLRGERENLANHANELQEKINSLNSELTSVLAELERANKTVAELHDESTAELERNITEIDEINRKVRANLDKEKADENAKKYYGKYADMTAQLEEIRKTKYDLLNNANLPLDGLSVENGELTYNGFKWDSMSGSEQLKVATAIVRKLNPNCGFVLLDKLEQMDTDTLNDFAKWLESEGLQAIATRVSSGDECSIIIEDGYIKSGTDAPEATPTWTEGEF